MTIDTKDALKLARDAREEVSTLLTATPRQGGLMLGLADTVTRLTEKNEWMRAQLARAMVVVEAACAVRDINETDFGQEVEEIAMRRAVDAWRGRYGGEG